MIRRILLTILALLLFLSIVGGAVSYTIMVKAPFLPGDKLFQTQLWSEQFWYVTLTLDKTERAWLLLDLLERRIDNIEGVRGTANEMRALVYFDAALDQVVLAIGQTPAGAESKLQARLMTLNLRNRLMTQAETTLAVMDTLAVMQVPSPEVAVLILRAKLESMLQTVSNSDSTPADIADLASVQTGLQVIPTSTPIAIAFFPSDLLDASRIVPFPDGADETVAHNFFPLTGGHADLSCTTCHIDGTYRGTNSTCIACHAANDPHNSSYGADCTRCHAIDAWPNVDFDHSLSGTSDCAVCHSPPPDHYQGACSACHTDAGDFLTLIFDHATIGDTDCSVCHASPQNHYAGACWDCHTDTGDFRNAIFDHSNIGDTDCSVCHTPPQKHYAGACRDCHTDTGDFRNAVFNHDTIGNADCSTCHRPPQYHYPGACRDCHTDTGDFRNVTFNHDTIGNTDCSACHTPPPDHYAGACRDCHHDTTDFRNATFNHDTIGDKDCSACHTPPAHHYAGACRDCHTDTGDFRNVTFNHNGIGDKDCSACHTPPQNHYAGACLDCHTDTSNFLNVTFNHSAIGNTDCGACHTPPTNHYPGLCSNCHIDTGNFFNISFSHDGLTDCQGCHIAPANHLPGQCSQCHTTNTFADITFTHTFPLQHHKANGQCTACHTGNDGSSYTCASCHDTGIMNKKHKDVPGYTTDCAACHADGTKP